MKNQENKIILLLFVLITVSIFIGCLFQDKTAGGGTVTGNVEGVILSEDEKTVTGAKVSLYKIVGKITSPDDVNEPVAVAETGENGKFSFDVDDGNYSVVAVEEGKYAFIDSIEAGTKEATELEGVLQNPGGMKGKIKNTLELQSPGSVVIHLIGTNIYKNVEDDGSFLITDIPSGFYTYVSYSTYQPEFSPKYDTVRIFPDSITDLGEYELKYFGIPIPKNVQVSYDTLNRVVTVSWDSITNFEFDAFVIYRGLEDKNGSNMKYLGNTKDTMFVDSIEIENTGGGFNPYQLDYRVFVVNMTGDTGKYWGTHSAEIVTTDYVIPEILESITLDYNPLTGVVEFWWDSLINFENFGGYQITRFISDNQIIDPSSSPENWDTLTIQFKSQVQDTIFPNLFSVDHKEPVWIFYSIGVFHKNWKVHGKMNPTTSSFISSFKSQKIVANAGEDQIVGSGTKVILNGLVDSSFFNIVKKEWIIGENTNWIKAENGIVSFVTPSDYKDTTIYCVFRIVDSVGNLNLDSVTIESGPLRHIYNTLPTIGGTMSYISKFNGKYWLLARKNNKYRDHSIYSSSDLNNWSVEVDSITFNQEPIFGLSNFDNNLFVTTSFRNSMGSPTSIINWASNDGSTWSKLDNTEYDSDYPGDYYHYKEQTIQLIDGIYVPRLIPKKDFNIFKSTRGGKWEHYLNIPSFLNHKNPFFIFEEFFCFVQDNSLQCTVNRGNSWTINSNFWESDLEAQSSPDYVSDSYSVGDYILLRITERPSNQNKLIYFHNGKWKNIPTTYINFIQKPIVLDNKLLFIDKDNNFSSIELPK